MRSSKKFILWTGAIVLATAACGGSDSSDDPPTEATEARSSAPEPAATTPDETTAPAEPVQVALLTKFPVAFFTAMEDAAKAYDEATDDVEVTMFSCTSPADIDCQIAQIEDGVAKGFEAMVITPMGVEVIPAMQAAADKGVKIILVDNDLADFTDKTAVAATDNVKGGEAAGAYLKSILKSGDSIGLMEGVRGVPALDARINGVTAALEGTGVTVVIGGAETKCDSAQGATVAEDLLTKNPDLTAIYSACDDPAIAAAKIAKDKGKDIIIMGYDGLPDAAKAIQAGDMDATIAQFPGRMAELGVEAAMNAVRGESVEAFIDTGTELVTVDNAGDFLTFQ